MVAHRAQLVLALALGLLALPAAAAAHDSGLSRAAAPRAAVDTGCPGRAAAPTRVVTGSFTEEQAGSYVMVPFEVPAGTTAVRVKYCFDQPELAVPQGGRHTIDMGLWEPGERFRGWGGSSHPDVTVSPRGFSPEAVYLKEPRANAAGYTTRGYRPGAIPAGRWEVELGVAAVVDRSQGDADGSVAWRVEIELSRDPSYLAEPYVPARYDPTPARTGAGWYAGDMHVHAEHSALGDATMTETFAYAFGPAKLDFITLSDYVTDTGWGEIGRHQGAHPAKLVARSSEVITYRGHFNNHASLRYVDHRRGPVLERRDDGSLVKRRDAIAPRSALAEIRAAGGWTQINHPTIFPSAVPAFSQLCRGCPWDWSSAETDYSLVDAVEVHTGPAGLKGGLEPGPNPFTPLAIDFYERALATGTRVAAVGSSDSHNAGRTNDPVTQSPIGDATTVVYADELSEDGIGRAVRAGHTYVKLFGNDGPDLRLEARAEGQGGPPATFGDTVRASRAQVEARVIGAGRASGPLTLLVVRDGATIAAVPVTDDEDFRHRFTADRPGRYRLQVMRQSAIEAVSSPVYLDPDAPRPAGAAGRGPATVRMTGSGRLRVRRNAVTVPCAATGLGLRRCHARLRARPRGRRIMTIGRSSAPLRGGRASVRVRLNATGRALMRRRPRGAPVTARVSATGAEGTVGPRARRIRLRVR